LCEASNRSGGREHPMNSAKYVGLDVHQSTIDSGYTAACTNGVKHSAYRAAALPTPFFISLKRNNPVLASAGPKAKLDGIRAFYATFHRESGGVPAHCCSMNTRLLNNGSRTVGASLQLTISGEWKFFPPHPEPLFWKCAIHNRPVLESPRASRWVSKQELAAPSRPAAILGFAEPSLKGEGMSSVKEFRCEICGTVSENPIHWFVIECTDQKLAVIKWDLAAATSPTARHFCGEAHAQTYISRWFESVCVPPKRVLKAI
jgi:hypothetical protein